MGEKDAKRAKTTAEALKAEAPATGAGGKGLAEQPSAMQLDAQVSPGQGTTATATTTTTTTTTTNNNNNGKKKGSGSDKDSKEKKKELVVVPTRPVLDKHGVECRIPLEVGSRLMCLWRDGKHHPVRVIERKKKDQGDKALPPASSAAQEQQNEDGTGVEDAYEYYVHYDEFNRRLDEWVQINKLDLSTLLRKDEKADGKKGSSSTKDGKRGGGRNQKRRVDSALEDAFLHGHGHHGGNKHPDPAHHGEGHEEFSADALQEHEEFTKVSRGRFWGRAPADAVARGLVHFPSPSITPLTDRTVPFPLSPSVPPGQEHSIHRVGQVRDGDVVLFALPPRVRGLQPAVLLRV